MTSWAESAFVGGARRGRSRPGPTLRGGGSTAESVREVPPGIRPRDARLADRPKARRRSGISAASPGAGRPDRPLGEVPGPPRAVPGPPDLPDPRHEGADPGLRRPDPAVDRTDQERRRGAASVAKYLNSPETPLFQKRRILYGADLARPAARSEGWVAVVEGYTDVIAAHQVGLSNAVGTLGTALGDDHVTTLRRLADRSVLVFDGDEAGQKAADRSLELFLGHEVDVRVLTLPEDLDPCDFLLSRGGRRRSGGWSTGRWTRSPSRSIAPRCRFDLDSAEGSRQAAEWVLAVLARVPVRTGAGLDLKVAKALDTLSRKLSVPVARTSRRRLGSAPEAEPARPRRLSGRWGPWPWGEYRGRGRRSRRSGPGDLDPIDRELVQIILNEPSVVGPPDHPGDGGLAGRRPAPGDPPGLLRPPRRGLGPERSTGSTSRLDDPGLRALAAGLLAADRPGAVELQDRAASPPSRPASPMAPRPGSRGASAGPEAPRPRSGPGRDRFPRPTRWATRPSEIANTIAYYPSGRTRRSQTRPDPSSFESEGGFRNG